MRMWHENRKRKYMYFCDQNVRESHLKRSSLPLSNRVQLIIICCFMFVYINILVKKVFYINCHKQGSNLEPFEAIFSSLVTLCVYSASFSAEVNSLIHSPSLLSSFCLVRECLRKGLSARSHAYVPYWLWPSRWPFPIALTLNWKRRRRKRHIQDVHFGVEDCVAHDQGGV